jgi:hypothetical protein
MTGVHRFVVTANQPALDIFWRFNLTGSCQAHGISKVVSSRNNAKGTCQV